MDALGLGHHAVRLAVRTGQVARGELGRAEIGHDHESAICQSASLSVVFDGTASALGYAYALGGRLDDGIALLDQAVQHAASTGTSYHSLLLSRLSEAYSMAGRTDEALAVAERALAMSRECGERGNEAWALRLLGEIAVRRDPLDAGAAEPRYREALALAADLGMNPLVAHCHLGLGTLAQRTGQREQGREHLATAAAMYREMGMEFYLEQAVAPHSATAG